MSQGYGAGDGQQQWGAPPPPQGSGQPHEQDQPGQQAQQAPAWGQPAPAPQASPAPAWGQPSAPAASPAPAWGQASPPPAPQQSAAPMGGYAGSASAPGGYPGTAPAATSGASPGLRKWLNISVITLLVLRTLVGVGAVILGFAVGFSSGAGLGYDGTLAVAGIGAILLLLLLGVIVLVTLAVLVLSIMVGVQSSGRARIGAFVIAGTLVLSWFAYLILVVAQNAVTESVAGSVVVLILQLLHWLLVVVALVVGLMMIRRAAAQTA